MWNNPKVSLTESNCLKIQWKCFIFVLMSNQLETILTNKIGNFFAYSCEYATAKESRTLIHFLCFRLIVNQCSKAWMNVIFYFENKFKCFRETEKNGMSRHNVHLFYLSRHDETSITTTWTRITITEKGESNNNNNRKSEIRTEKNRKHTDEIEIIQVGVHCLYKLSQ